MAQHMIDTAGLTENLIEQIATEGQARGLNIDMWVGNLRASNAAARDWANARVQDIRDGATAPVSASWTRLASGAWGAALDTELAVGATVVIENRYGKRETVTLSDFVEAKHLPIQDRTVYTYSVSKVA